VVSRRVHTKGGQAYHALTALAIPIIPNQQPAPLADDDIEGGRLVTKLIELGKPIHVVLLHQPQAVLAAVRIVLGKRDDHVSSIDGHLRRSHIALHDGYLQTLSCQRTRVEAQQ
jgi:hypothetical protein